RRLIRLEQPKELGLRGREVKESAAPQQSVIATGSDREGPRRGTAADDSLQRRLGAPVALRAAWGRRGARRKRGAKVVVFVEQVVRVQKSVERVEVAASQPGVPEGSLERLPREDAVPMALDKARPGAVVEDVVVMKDVRGQ